ncbi:MAG: hypothetical protein KAT15_07295, partial [Bacteroidales bacterium]|nr:hypothetical protein [Bacteroidales bacterium]
MRWKGLITLLILLALGTLISRLFLNGWMEKGLEMAGEAVVGTKVEVDNFRFSLKDLSAGWDRLQITDP